MAQKRDFTPIGAGTPPDAATNIINQNFQTQADINLTNLISDGTTNRVLIGYQKDGFGADSHGIKVSKAGTDVTDAAIEDLLFTTAQTDAVKILDTGTITVSKGASSSLAEGNVDHTFGVSPFVISFFQVDGEGEWFSVPFIQVQTTGTDAGKVMITVNAYGRDEEAQFQITTPNFASNTYYTAAMSFNFKYFLALPQSSTET